MQCIAGVVGFLDQSHISRKNRKRLGHLIETGDEELTELAQLILDVAQVAPHKRRRFKTLARSHRDLIRRLEKAGLIEDRSQWRRDYDGPPDGPSHDAHADEESPGRNCPF